VNLAVAASLYAPCHNFLLQHQVLQALKRPLPPPLEEMLRLILMRTLVVTGNLPSFSRICCAIDPVFRQNEYF
jgi:hypothetical protein